MKYTYFVVLVALLYSGIPQSEPQSSSSPSLETSAAPPRDEDYDPDFEEDIETNADIQKDDEYTDDDENPEEPPSENPKIISVSQLFYPKKGDSVVLPCEVTDTTNVIMWYKDSQLIMQDAVKIGKVSEHVNVLNNRSLHIANVSDNDYGEYKCEIVLGKFGNPFISHRLLNPAPHNITISAKNGITELESGGRLELHCSAEGEPKPTITWHKENLALGITGETLVIENLKHSDEGTYRCLADNKIGNPQHAFIIISILHKPRVDIQKIMASQNDRLNVELVCDVRAVPAATVLWQKNGKNVVASGNIAFDNLGHRHILKISNVKEEHFGEYTCSAVNHLGKSAKSVMVSGTPMVVEFKEPSKNLKDVELAWVVESVESITEQVVEYRKVGDDQWKALYPEISQPNNYLYEVRYRLPGLLAGKYEARMRSKNSFGWSQWSEIVEFEVSKKHGHHNKHHPKKEHKKIIEATTPEPAPLEPESSHITVKTGAKKSHSSATMAAPTVGVLCLTLLLLRN